MKAVLDTNVLVSGMINAHGAPGRVVDLLRAGALQPVVDDRILAEYADVLAREELRSYFTAADRGDILEFLHKNAEHAAARTVIAGLPDPTDAPFLEIALAAEAPLVTGNKKHFPADQRRGAIVLSPVEFLARFFAG
jgi:uncharacterized protein